MDAEAPAATASTSAGGDTGAGTGAPGQLGAEVTVTLEVEATLPGGASDQIVRTVTENSRTLKFTSHGFESE